MNTSHHAFAVPLLVTVAFVAHRNAAARDWTETEINKISGVYETSLVLQAGETYDFWTSNLTLQSSCSGASADPVMHVWQTYPSTGWVASNDDCNVSGLATGLNPCVRFTAPTSLPPLGVMVVTVVVHGYSTCSDSEGRLHVSGPGFPDPNALGRFGGMHLDSLDPYWGLSWLQNDTVQVVRSPDSITPTSSLRAYATKTERSGSCSSNDIRLLARSAAGIAGGATMVMPSASTGTCTGGSAIRYRLIIGSSSQSDANRKARVYINDKLITDSDGDGLGNLLEDALNTCKQTGGTNCFSYGKPKDTDGDGLEDAAELLGVSTGGLRLPAWGANPRHKDVFVELDWGPGVTAFMPSLTAQTVAANFVGGTAANAGNPDGAAGIAVHFDIDLTPTSCATSGTGCSTVYGDWGGSSTVASGDYLASGLADMSIDRRGVFFHGLVLPGGNAASTDWKFRVGRGSGEPPFKRNTTHALGLALGATRWGGDAEPRLDCKPSYPSVMNYAYANLSTNTFSTGAGPTLDSTTLNEQSNPGLDASKLSSAFGLTATSTSIDWNRDGVLSSSPRRAVTRWATGGVRDCNVADIHPTIENLDLHPIHSPGLVDFPFTPPDSTDEVGQIIEVHVTSTGALKARSGGRPIACATPSSPAGCECAVSNNASCSSFSATEFTVTTGVTSSAATAIEEPQFFNGSTIVTDVPRLIVVYTKGSGSSRRAYARAALEADSFGPEAALDIPVWPFGPGRNDDGALVHVFDHPLLNQRNYYYFVGESNPPSVFRARLAKSFPDGTDTAFQLKAVDQMLYNGQPIVTSAAPAAVSIAGLPYFVTTNASGQLTLWRENSYSGNTATPISNAFSLQSGLHNEGHPSMMFHESMSGGAVHIMYPSSNNLFGAWSVGSWGAGATPFVPDGRMYSHTVTGIQSVGLARLVPRASSATEIQRLEMVSGCPSCSVPGQPVPMKFAPFASGVFAFPETDSNDFVSFRQAMCGRLRADTSCSTACAICGIGVQGDESLLP